MDPIEWLRWIIILIFGAYIAYVLIDALTKTSPGFSQYGWPILAAIVAAIILFIRRSLGPG